MVTKQLQQYDSSSKYIIRAATKRGISFKPIINYSMADESEHLIYQLSLGKKRHELDITLPAMTNATSLARADNKILTQAIIDKNNFPGTGAQVFNTFENALEYFRTINQTCVTKPVIGGGGEGVSVNISDEQGLHAGVKYAKDFHDSFIVERFFSGIDYRFLMINHKLAAIAYRSPPYVIGDGKSSIQTLIEQINMTRPDNRVGALSKISIDDGMKNYLLKEKMHLDTIPKRDQRVQVRENANLFTGGFSVAVDISEVHPSTIQMLERLTKTFDMAIAGVDIVCNNIKEPLSEGRGAIIEINAKPRIRMHEEPSIGKPIAVSEKIIDMLFPETIHQNQLDQSLIHRSFEKRL